MGKHKYAYIPVAILSEDLTLWQLKVLCALYYHRAKDANTVWPNRQTLAKITGMHVSNVSKATSELERMGLIKKCGRGGFGRAAHYTLIEKSVVADSTTVADSAIRGVADSATQTVADSATRERISERIKVNIKKERGARARTHAPAHAPARDGVAPPEVAQQRIGKILSMLGSRGSGWVEERRREHKHRARIQPTLVQTQADGCDGEPQAATDTSAPSAVFKG